MHQIRIRSRLHYMLLLVLSFSEKLDNSFTSTIGIVAPAVGSALKSDER
jgi:hypothetical protein